MDTNVRSASLEALRRRTGIGRWNPQQQSEAWIFLLPGLAGFIIFVLIPIVMSMGISFTRWDLLSPPQFNGISNYIELFTRDRIFGRVLGNTLFYMVALVPLQLTIGLTLAVALNQRIRGMPVLSPDLFHAGRDQHRRCSARLPVATKP